MSTRPLDSACPFCGKRIGGHTDGTLLGCSTAWLADPERTSSDLLIYFIGTVTGIVADLRSEVEKSTLADYLERRMGHFEVAVDRIAAQERITPSPGAS